MLVALIPVKDLPKAKARLASVLDEGGRRELVIALFRDVLAATLACPSIDVVGVVTQDAEVLAITGEANAEGMLEAGDLNESLNSAARKLAERRVDRVLVLAADLPLVSGGDIETVATSTADVALVPSGDGGTNALACPTLAFAFQYGPGSAQQHREAAWKAGLDPELLDLPNLTLDIDTPDDLERLQSAINGGRQTGANTLSALAELGLVSDARRIR